MGILRRVLRALAAGLAGEEVEGPETARVQAPGVNPFLDPVESEQVFEQLYTWMSVMWPVVECSGRTQVPIYMGQAAMASVLDVFTMDDDDAERGLMFELARLAVTYLPPDTKAEEMPGCLYKGPSTEGAVDIRPELAAFFESTFDGEWDRAVAVGEAARKRAADVFPNANPQDAGNVGVQFLASAILINISREWSLHEMTDFLDLGAGRG